MILQTLYQNCIKRGIEFFDEYYVLDILLTEGRCVGVVAYELATGEIHTFQAKSSSSPPAASVRSSDHLHAHTLTGDGMAITYRRGCRWRTWSSTSSTRRAWRDWGAAHRGCPR